MENNKTNNKKEKLWYPVIPSGEKVTEYQIIKVRRMFESMNILFASKDEKINMSIIERVARQYISFTKYVNCESDNFTYDNNNLLSFLFFNKYSPYYLPIRKTVQEYQYEHITTEDLVQECYIMFLTQGHTHDYNFKTNLKNISFHIMEKEVRRRPTTTKTVKTDTTSNVIEWTTQGIEKTDKQMNFIHEKQVTIIKKGKERLADYISTLNKAFYNDNGDLQTSNDKATNDTIQSILYISIVQAIKATYPTDYDKYLHTFNLLLKGYNMNEITNILEYKSKNSVHRLVSRIKAIIEKDILLDNYTLEKMDEKTQAKIDKMKIRL